MDIRVAVYKSIAHIFNALCIYIYVPYPTCVYRERDSCSSSMNRRVSIDRTLYTLHIHTYRYSSSSSTQQQQNKKKENKYKSSQKFQRCMCIVYSQPASVYAHPHILSIGVFFPFFLVDDAIVVTQFTYTHLLCPTT